MDKKDLQAIGNLLDKKLDEKLDQKLDEKFDQKLSPIKTQLGEIAEKLDSHTASLVSLENTIGAYSDALDIERQRVNEHDTRLEKIEAELPI